MLGLSVLQDNLVLTDQEFEQISALVYEHCGIDLHDGKKELVRSRLGKLLRQKEFSSFADYYKYVLSDSSKTALTELTDAISTNLTSFFRESQHFDFVSQTLLPELAGRKTGSARKIRCWSAGCSSGEEPYTIAITLLENLQQAGDWDIKILATDISSRVLQRAAEGIYDAERVAPVPPAAKNRYLTKVRGSGQPMFQVSPVLQKMIVFKYLNLMERTLAVQRPHGFYFLSKCHDLFRQAHAAEAGQPLLGRTGSGRLPVHRPLGITDGHYPQIPLRAADHL